MISAQGKMISWQMPCIHATLYTAVWAHSGFGRGVVVFGVGLIEFNCGAVVWQCLERACCHPWCKPAWNDDFPSHPLTGSCACARNCVVIQWYSWGSCTCVCGSVAQLCGCYCSVGLSSLGSVGIGRCRCCWQQHAMICIVLSAGRVMHAP